MLAHGSGLCYVSFDAKPVSQVVVPVDGEGSFLRTRHQLVSHTPNVFILDFHNVAPTYFGLFLRYVLFDAKPVSRVVVQVDDERSFYENQTSIRVTQARCINY